jgi:hypothetical protein
MWFPVEIAAGMERLKWKSLNLLNAGARFHDIGFIKQPAYHELIGARIISEFCQLQRQVNPTVRNFRFNRE